MTDKNKLLIEKFERIAQGDLLADEFTEALQVNKALHAYQELNNRPLTETSYRTQIALLNAALIDQFEGGSYTVSTNRVHGNFTKFDQLVTASESLPQTESLKDFQRYAKSLLYYRIGDYLLLSLKPVPEPFDRSQFIAGLCAYAISLDHLCGGSEKHELHTSAEAYNVMELKALLAHNAITIEGFTGIAEGLRDNKLGAYVETIFIKKPKAGAFVKSDIVKHTRLLDLYKIESKKIMSLIWNARRHAVFFKRFLWLRARLPADDDEFLDNSVTRFPDFPESLSAIYDIQDFSLFDLKVLLFRMSIYTDISEIKPKTAKKFVYPPHIQPASNKQFLRIWSIINTLLDSGSYARDKTTDRINFVSMLEELRQGNAYESDRTNMLKTANYLYLKVTRNDKLAPKKRQIIMEMFERYANSVLTPKYATQASTLFPPHKDAEKLHEIVIHDTIHFIFAQYYLHLEDRTKADFHLKSISKIGQEKRDVQILAEKIQKRESKNSSPESVESFQMVDEVKIEPVDDDSTLDDTFVSCNQTNKTFEVVNSPAPNTTLNVTQQPDNTTIVDVSKVREEVREELEVETKSDVNRQIMISMLEQMMNLSLQKTQELKKVR